MDKSLHADEQAIVFLHAYPLNGEMWRDQISGFSDRTALAPHFPGFGGRAAGPRTLDGFAESIVAALDEAGLEKAVLVGLSMGGYVAFRVWSGWRDRVAALVLADTRAGPDTEAAARRRTEQAARARAEGVGWMPDAMLEGVVGETTRRERPDVVERVRRTMLRADPEGVARALTAMRDRPDSTPLLPTIDVPTLVLVGEEDTLTDVDEARRIAGAVPGSELQVIPGAGHLSNLENPSAFMAALRSFLA